jgi:hypothetical protein
MSAYGRRRLQQRRVLRERGSVSMTAIRRPFTLTSVRVRPCCSRGGPTRVAVSLTQPSSPVGQPVGDLQ